MKGLINLQGKIPKKKRKQFCYRAKNKRERHLVNFQNCLQFRIHKTVYIINYLEFIDKYVLRITESQNRTE